MAYMLNFLIWGILKKNILKTFNHSSPVIYLWYQTRYVSLNLGSSHKIYLLEPENIHTGALPLEVRLWTIVMVKELIHEFLDFVCCKVGLFSGVKETVTLSLKCKVERILIPFHICYFLLFTHKHPIQNRTVQYFLNVLILVSHLFYFALLNLPVSKTSKKPVIIKY